MPEHRRIGYNWHLRQVMAQRNLWKSTDLMPLLKARGISLSESQIWRLVTGTPERIPARTFAALCDILSCSGITLNVDCVRCGKEDELYSGGRCWRCTLSDLVDETLADPATGTIPPALTPLAAGLKQMERANSGLTWLRQPHVQAFLSTLTSTPTAHEALDKLPTSATLEHVRALLVEHGALPRRDEYLATFNRWLTGVPDRLNSHDDRDILLRYVRWDHLRKMHQATPIPRGMFLRSKQSITVAVDFLNWLAERDVDLQDLSQSDFDDWATGGKTTRLLADRFLNWARRSRLVNTTSRWPGTAAGRRPG